MGRIGAAFEKLGAVVITHGDMDHIGGLAEILRAAAHKIKVLAHEEEKPYIQCERPPIRLAQIEAQLTSGPQERRQQTRALYESLKNGYKKLSADVDGTLADGDELPCCGGIAVIETPGHTPGHICLYHKRSKTLIAGDALNVDGGKLVPAPRFMAIDPEASARSLKKLVQYDIETVVCYHGGLYNDQANRRIAALAEP
jgi:glyoxylase-like metal-dependent hydrolase (beta-lactamase superfamily II)